MVWTNVHRDVHVAWKNTEQRTCPEELNGRCNTLNSAMQVGEKQVLLDLSVQVLLSCRCCCVPDAGVLKELASRSRENRKKTLI